MPKQYWLLKTDPESFSWDDLNKCPQKTTFWNGVRNYQARNFLRDQIKKDDGVLFYHSQQDLPAIMGTAVVTQEGYPDPTQFDAKSQYFDADASPENPRWFMVDIQADQEFKQSIPLFLLRETPGLEKMVLLQRGSRLSVQPVTPEEWKIIVRLEASH